jgi:acyl dehydratase
MAELYFEDFAVGDVYAPEEAFTLTAEAIKKFAEQWDPQFFHLDEAAAEQSFFHGLAASGWQTACIAMRLRVRNVHVAGGMIGAGVDEIRWTQPVRPGDTVRIEQKIMAVRRLASRPEFGMVKAETTMYNQRNEVVMRMKVNFLAPVKDEQG